jgi:LPS sulfotransferase NodH
LKAKVWQSSEGGCLDAAISPPAVTTSNAELHNVTQPLGIGNRMFYPTPPNNVHLAKISAHFGSLQKPSMPIPRNLRLVFLCFTNRCGSNYVAELFSSSGRFNLAGEDLNYDTVIETSKRLSFTSFLQYFLHLAKVKSKSDVLMLKVAPSHLELLGKSGLLEQVAENSRYVLIERADKLAQAISFSIAFATGRFTSQMTSKIEDADLTYSHKQINDIINGLAESYRQFDIFFARNGIVPAHVVYEDLVAAPVEHIGKIARRIDLMEANVNLDKIQLERQASAINRQWRQLYLDGERAALDSRK